MKISKKKLDKSVQSIIFPFNLMKILSMTPTYYLKDDFIQTNIIRSYIISFFGTLFYILLFMYRHVLMDSMSLGGKTTFMDVVTNIESIISIGAFIVNYIIGLFQMKNSIAFVVIFQNVDRLLNDDSVSRSYIVWNWICLIMDWFVYLFVFPTVAILVRMNFLLIVISNLVIIFDYNEIYAIRMIKLLETKIVLWTRRVLIAQDIEIGEKNNNQILFQAYVDILKCYDIHKRCIHFFVSIINYIAIIIEINIQ